MFDAHLGAGRRPPCPTRGSVRQGGAGHHNRLVHRVARDISVQLLRRRPAPDLFRMLHRNPDRKENAPDLNGVEHQGFRWLAYEEAASAMHWPVEPDASPGGLPGWPRSSNELTCSAEGPRVSDTKLSSPVTDMQTARCGKRARPSY
jgi:hypothetical protein